MVKDRSLAEVIQVEHLKNQLLPPEWQNMEHRKLYRLEEELLRYMRHHQEKNWPLQQAKLCLLQDRKL